MEKRSIYLLSLFVILVAVMIAGCTSQTPQEQPSVPQTPQEQPSTEQTPPPGSQQLVIKTGTSFGMCMGYCERDIIITSEKIVFHKSGWNEDGLLPEVTEEVPITAEQWDALSNSLDFNKFNALEEVIGCPNCADGGVEWIEIDDGKTTKRVKFDHGDTISEIEDFIIEIRKIRSDVFSQFED